MSKVISRIVILETEDHKLSVEARVDTDHAQPVMAVLGMVINGIIRELEGFENPNSAEALAYTCLANGSRLVACAREFYELANRYVAEATKH